MRPNMQPVQKTDLKAALRRMTAYLRKSLGILIFALIGMMLCQYGYFTTIQYSNAGTATVLQYTGPAMILVYLCIRNRRRPKIYEVVALFCSMFGTFILATHGNPSELAILPQALFWGMVAAVALVVYTLQPAYGVCLSAVWH